MHFHNHDPEQFPDHDVVVVFPSLAGSLLPLVEYDSKFKGKGIV